MLKVPRFLKTNDANVIPFNKDEGILAVKSGAEAEGMLKDFLQKSDEISGANVKPIKEGQTTVKKDSLPIRLIKNINTELRLTDLTNEGYSKEQAEVLIKARNKMTSGEEINPNEALLRVKEEMADDAGVDVDELDFDFEIEEPEPIDEFAEGGRVNFNQGSNLTGIKQTFDDKTSEAFRVGSLTSAMGYGPENYQDLQNFVSMPVQNQKEALFSFRQLRSPDPLNSNKGPFEKQGFSSDIRHGLGTSAGKGSANTSSSPAKIVNAEASNFLLPYK